MPNQNLAHELPWQDIPPRTPDGVEGLDAFQTESSLQAEGETAADVSRAVVAPRRRPAGAPLVLGTAACFFAALITSGVWAYRAYAVAPPSASLSLQSTPAGAEVSIDGKAAGVTPLALTLPPGTYEVVLAASADRRRTLAVTLKAGDSVVQGVEWADAPAPVSPTTGNLRVQTERPGQVVFVDDKRRGTSPLTISGLSPGEHRVVVNGEGAAVRRQVTIAAGETVSLVLAPNAPAMSTGWVRVHSPVLLQVRAAGNLVGNSESDRVLLPAGDHELAMSNDTLGYSVSRRVSIAPGRTVELRITPPSGTLNINAMPWAEVWIDNERVGETPLANVSRPIGTYAVTFRHPELGERTRTVTVSLKGPTRLGVDMRER